MARRRFRFSLLMGALVLICPVGANGRKSPQNAALPACLDCPPPSIQTDKDVQVKLTVTINADGRVLDAEVVQSSEPKINKKVVAAVRKWRFQAVRGADGTRVGGEVPVVINLHVRHQTPHPGRDS
jgi:TonB family protein